MDPVLFKLLCATEQLKKKDHTISVVRMLLSAFNVDPIETHYTLTEICDILVDALNLKHEGLHNFFLDMFNYIYTIIDVKDLSVKYDKFLTNYTKMFLGEKLKKNGELKFGFHYRDHYYREKIENFEANSTFGIGMEAKLKKYYDVYFPNNLEMFFNSFAGLDDIFEMLHEYRIPWCEYTPLVLKRRKQLCRRIITFMCATRHRIVKNIRNKIMRDYYTEIFNGKSRLYDLLTGDLNYN